jgi:hypothetical protein
MGPGPAPDPGARGGPGSAYRVKVRAGLAPGAYIVQNISGLLGPFFFAKNVIRSCSHLMHATQSGHGNKSHRPHLLRDFRSCPFSVTYHVTNMSSGIFIPFLKCQNKDRCSYRVVKWSIQESLPFTGI